EDSTVTDLFTVDHSGYFTATQGSIVHTTPSSTVFNLVAAAAQSANIFNILDSALSNLLNVQSDGKLQLIAGGAINEFSTDGLLAGNSDLAVPTEKAVKTYVDANSGGSGVPTGSILAYGSTTAPTGFLKCDGAAVSRATYAALFAIIGTTFGPGDGSTTFNVPDLNARSPMGAGAETGLTTRTIGNKLGAETNTHNHSGGAHTHTIPDHNHGAGTLYALIYDDGAGSLYSKTTTDLFSADRKSRITAQVAADSEGATDILGNTASKTGLSTNQGSGTTGNASPTIVHPVQVVQYIIKT
ncbi:MAG: phage tail protein, partial [Dehalococcoidia bacterium]